MNSEVPSKKKPVGRGRKRKNNGSTNKIPQPQTPAESPAEDEPITSSQMEKTVPKFGKKRKYKDQNMTNDDCVKDNAENIDEDKTPTFHSANLQNVDEPAKTLSEDIENQKNESKMSNDISSSQSDKISSDLYVGKEGNKVNEISIDERKVEISVESSAVTETAAGQSFEVHLDSTNDEPPSVCLELAKEDRRILEAATQHVNSDLHVPDSVADNNMATTLNIGEDPQIDMHLQEQNEKNATPETLKSFSQEDVPVIEEINELKQTLTSNPCSEQLEPALNGELKHARMKSSKTSLDQNVLECSEKVLTNVEMAHDNCVAPARSTNKSPDEIQKNELETRGNSKEQLETRGNSKEQLETRGNSKEQLETRGNSKEQLETRVDSKEQLETRGNSKEQLETRVDSEEQLETRGNSIEQLETKGNSNEQKCEMKSVGYNDILKDGENVDKNVSRDESENVLGGNFSLQESIMYLSEMTEKNGNGTDADKLMIKNGNSLGKAVKESAMKGLVVVDELDDTDMTDSQLCAADIPMPNIPSSHSFAYPMVRPVPKMTKVEDGTNIVKGLIKELSFMNKLILKTRREIETARRERQGTVSLPCSNKTFQNKRIM